MVRVAVTGFSILTLVGFALASPVATTKATEPTEADPDFFTTVDLNGVKFINKVRRASGVFELDLR